MAEKYPSDHYLDEDVSNEDNDVVDSWEDRADSEKEEDGTGRLKAEDNDQGEITKNDMSQHKQHTFSGMMSDCMKSEEAANSESDTSASDGRVDDEHMSLGEETLEDNDPNSTDSLSHVTLEELIDITCKGISRVENNLVDFLSDDQIFWVDGDSLLDFVCSHTDIASWGRQGQFLFLTYMAEKFLQLFINKGGKMELNFFGDGEHLWKNSPPYMLLARRALILHFMHNTTFTVFTEYENCFESSWRELIKSRLPTFLLMNEGSASNINSTYYNSLTVVSQITNLVIVHMPSVVNSGAKLMAYAAVPNQSFVALAKTCSFLPKLKKVWMASTAENKGQILKASSDLTKQLEKWVKDINSDWIKSDGTKGCMDWRTFLSVCASAQFLYTARACVDDADSQTSHNTCRNQDIVRVFLLHTVLLSHLPLTHRAQRLKRGLELYQQFGAQWNILIPSNQNDAGLENKSFLEQIQMSMAEILSHQFLASAKSKWRLHSEETKVDLSMLSTDSLADLMDGHLFHQVMLMMLQCRSKGEPEPLLSPEIKEEFAQCWSLVQNLLACFHTVDKHHMAVTLESNAFPLIQSDVKMACEDVWSPNDESDQFPMEKPLLPIENKLVNDFTGDIKSRMVTLSREEAEQTYDRSQAKQFDERYHWHSLRPLTDDFVRTQENQSLCQKIVSTNTRERNWKLRQVQTYMRHMQRYGESLEGGSLRAMNISTKGHKETQKNESKKAAAIRKEKEEKKMEETREKELRMWSFQNKDIADLVDSGNFEKTFVKLEELCKTFTAAEVKLEILMEIIKISFQQWTKQCKDQVQENRECGGHSLRISSQKDFQYPVRIMASVQEICLSERYFSLLSKKYKICLADILAQLGFVDVAKHICPQDDKTAKDVKDGKKHPVLRAGGNGKRSQGGKAAAVGAEKHGGAKPGTATCSFSVGMSFQRFQLEHMGHLLQRVAPLPRDPRVSGFIPDAWQRILLDVVDKKESALIVAPTSSGKTYASYYCMEKVLREDDDGVIVYVSPTKALVNQVAATVYARYKGKNMPAGRAVMGVFTRDYRQDALNSQILITVPQCLEILLLSPHQQAWVSKLRYIIFDEVHCLGAEIGAEVWEHLILMVPCPFLALSATIANPHHLHSWMKNAKQFACDLEQQLQANQKTGPRKRERNAELRLVIFNERHADLEKYVFAPSSEDLKGRSTPHPGTAFLPMHPFSALDIERVEMKRCFPADLSLSPSEALRLHDAMLHVFSEDSRVKALRAEVYFEDQLFIKRNTVREFEGQLKEMLLKMLLEEGKRSQVGMVKQHIGQNFHHLYEEFVANWQKKHTSRPEGDEFGYKTCCTLMMALKEKNLLPALVFCYDRGLCEVMACQQSDHMVYLDDKVNSSKDKQNEMRAASKKDKAVKKQKQKMRDMSNEKLSKLQKRRHTEGDDMEAQYSKSTLQKTVLTPPSNKVDQEELSEILCRVYDPMMKGCLDRGVGWHHSGVNAKGREAVETLFRKKHVQLVTATGTLALGIHMPCKTVVIFSDSPFFTPIQFRQMSGRAGRRGYDLKGNVVFCGTRYPKIHQLINASMSDINGNFPISVTLVLRLLLYTSKASRYPEQAFVSARTLLEHSFFCHENRQLQHQVKHHFLFSVQFLLHLGLIDFDGCPLEMTGLATHLHYHEPANFIFIQFLQKGLFHQLLNRQNVKGSKELPDDALKGLLLVLCHLFARQPVMSALKRMPGYNGMVFLPSLPPEFSSALKSYNTTVKNVYQSYLSFVARYVGEEFGGDRHLPLSKLEFNPGMPIPLSKSSDLEENPDTLTEKLLLSASPNIACSTFVGTCGFQDKFLLQTNNLDLLVQSQVYADINVIPLQEEHPRDRRGKEIRLNGYAYDFFHHGSSQLIMKENGLRSGDAYQQLKDFFLVLKSINTSLKEMEGDAKDDIVIRAFDQLTESYQEKFSKAYPRYK